MKEAERDQEEHRRWIPGEERERQEPEQTRPEQGRRGEETRSGGVFQTAEGEVRIIIPQRSRVLLDEETNDHRPREEWSP